MGFASIGHHISKRRTITVQGRKVAIRSVNRTWMGNHAGFNVFINGEKFFCNQISRKDAEDFVLDKWLKIQGLKEPGNQ